MTETSSIRSADLVLTSACNLRCAYCYQRARTDEVVDEAIGRDVIDRLFRSGAPEVTLRFYGGEPLLVFDLMRRLVEYARESAPPKMRVRFGLVTNGTLADDETVDFLVRNHVDTELSFDGIEEAQSLRREGTFPVLDRLVGRFRAADLGYFARQLTVAVTVTPDTLRYLPVSIDYLFSRDVRRIQLDAAIGAAPAWRPERIVEFREAFDEIFESSLRRYREHGDVPLLLFRKFRRCGGDGERRGGRMCGIGESGGIAVDVDGETHGCVLFARSFGPIEAAALRDRTEALRMGPLGAPGLSDRYDSFREAVGQDRLFMGKAYKRSPYRRCADCEHLDTCMICPVAIGLGDDGAGQDDPDLVPAFPCAFQIASLDARNRFPAQDDPAEVIRRRLS